MEYHLGRLLQNVAGLKSWKVVWNKTHSFSGHKTRSFRYFRHIKMEKHQRIILGVLSHILVWMNMRGTPANKKKIKKHFESLKYIIWFRDVYNYGIPVEMIKILVNIQFWEFRKHFTMAKSLPNWKAGYLNHHRNYYSILTLYSSSKFLLRYPYTLIR